MTSRANSKSKSLCQMVCSAFTILITFQLSGSIAQPQSRTAELSVYWNSPEDHLSVTHGGQIPLELYPPGMRSLEGTPAQSTFLLTVTLRDEANEIIGIAAELEDFSTPLEENKPFEVWWLLLLPGRGALYIHQFEHFPQALEDVFAEAAESGEAWEGSFAATTTLGSAVGGKGRVVGGTGEFEGAHGTVTESMIVSSVSADGDIKSRSRLELELTFKP